MEGLPDENDEPSILLPCVSCNRTFRPEALAKHSKVCEKSLMKKRKKFDSSKQRIQGTDLAEFLPSLPTFTKKPEKLPVKKNETHPSNVTQNSTTSSKTLSSPKTKWREKHNELVQTIKAARLPQGQSTSPAIKPSDQEPCPYCDRTFGPKAYDRHLEWCKEQRTRIQPKSPASQRAKERLEARTKYRAPLSNKGRQRSVSKDKSFKSLINRDASPSTSKTCQPTLVTRRKSSAATGVTESPSAPNISHSFVKEIPSRSTRSVPSLKKVSQTSSGTEPYDPYKSAEQQMNELLQADKDPLKPIPPTKFSPLLSSPTSAFTKFSSVSSPEPVFTSEPSDNNNDLPADDSVSHNSSEKSDSPLTLVSTTDNYSNTKDSNQNTISLSNLSLCSTISIESVESNKNNCRLWLSNSARVQENNVHVPLRRSVSALESRRNRGTQKGKLRMEDMLYGSSNSEGERYFGSPIITDDLTKNYDQISSGFLDVETLNAEQELLKCMSEFEKLLSSSPSSSPSSPSLKLFPSVSSSYQVEDPDGRLENETHNSNQPGGPDSAYSSLNRKSPVGGEQDVRQETCSPDSSSVARFCHECGAKYPVLAAKFCCQCGVRRLVI